jgi:hypothetical protein
MATTERRLTTTDVASIGLVAESAVGVAVIALGIVGLGGIAVNQMVAIATIIFGVALLMQGMEMAVEASAGESETGGAMMVEVLAGLAGVVLGILAFIGDPAASVTPAAMIVFGGALLLSGATRIASPRFAGEAWTGALSAQILTGFAAAVLGIIAYIVKDHAQSLTLAALLPLGASLVVSGAAIGFMQAVGMSPRPITHAETPHTPFPGA